ncbi:MAG: hypothetical protein KA712_13145 [Myxococcales bacterium]|nr:hypothetical protein [Myxococcales bacterium]
MTIRVLPASKLLAAGVLLLSVAILVVSNWLRLGALEAATAAQGQVLFVGGGDIWLRDLPKFHQSRRGHLLADPHFEGEPHWYPPLNPWMAAGISNLTGARGAGAFFRLEILAVGAFLLAVLATQYLTTSLRGLMFAVPLGVLLGWIVPGNGLYPNDTARAGLLATLVAIGLSGVRSTTDARARSKFGVPFCLGALVGVLGLWNGASFFVSLVVLLTWTTLPILDTLLARRRPVPHLVFKPVVAFLGCLVAMSPLLLPQLLRYGKIKSATSARVWLDPMFGGGLNARAALDLPLFAQGSDLALLAAGALAVLLCVALPRLPWKFNAVAMLPLFWAYLVCMFFAHLGFAMHDPAHPWVASLIRRLIPAPPHGFLGVSRAILLCLKLFSAWAVASLAVTLWETRLVPKTKPALVRVMRATGWLLGAALCVLVPLRMPTEIGFYSQPEDAHLMAWARKVRRLTGRDTVFVQYPGRLTALAGIRVLHFGAPDHANHYVQPARQRLRDEINALARRGAFPELDDVFKRYGVRYLVELPGPKDPVMFHCGGAPLLEHGGFKLLPVKPCA